MQADVLFLAWNRLAFTRYAFDRLIENTDWTRVRRLCVYDDGSVDGTRAYLQRRVNAVPVPVSFVVSEFRSPVAAMLDYLSVGGAEVFAKIDNDIACPPGWLEKLLGVMERSPELELLGMQAGFTDKAPDDFDGVYGYEPCRHIGGVGLMRTSAFERGHLHADGRFGFTSWQQRFDDFGTPVARGWVTPDIPAVQLDLLPFSPWLELAEHYVAQGWSRRWPPYAEASRDLWKWMPPPKHSGSCQDVCVCGLDVAM